MEGMTGTIAWLSHVPGSPQGGLYRPANSDFPFVTQLRLQRADGRATACAGVGHYGITPLAGILSNNGCHHTILR